MKILRCGDPHTTISNLADSEKLLQFIYDTAKKEKVDRIEFLGDQFHNHAILRSEIVAFWDKWLTKISKEFLTVVLCGNHDMSNQKDNSLPNALDVFKDVANSNLIIVTSPIAILPFAYMPYIHDNEEFVNTANIMAGATNILICHATFNGARYETGMFAPDGIDANLLEHKQIISGHMHTNMEFGKIWYPGTPKWDTASDAGQNKGIWLCEHDSNGFLTSKTLIPTWGIVTPIVSYTWSENEPQPEIPDNVNASIEIVGSNLFVSKAKSLFKGKAKIKTKVTDKVIRENRKSSLSVLDFLENNFKTSVNKEKLISYLKEKQYV